MMVGPISRATLPDRARRTADPTATVALTRPLFGFESAAFAEQSTICYCTRADGEGRGPAGWNAGRIRAACTALRELRAIVPAQVGKRQANGKREPDLFWLSSPGLNLTTI